MANFAKISLPLFLALIFPALSVAGQFPAPTVEYSGDSRIESSGQEMKMKIFMAKEKQRIEMNNPQAGMNSVLILRMDKNIGWNLMPDQKMYTEINLEESRKRSGDFRECSYDSSEKGTDTVNGIGARKSHAVVKCPDSEFEGDFWVTPEGITVKMDVTGKTKEGEKMAMKQEMTSLKIGPVDPSLFEIPAGYASMGNVSDLMKDAQRQMEEGQKQQAAAMEEAQKQEAKRREEEQKRLAEEEERRKKEEAAREYSAKKRKEAAPSTVDEAVKGGLKKLFKW